MDIALTVLEIVAPVFLLATVGFAWVKMGFEYRVQFVTRLGMSLATPCLVFVALMQSEIEPSSLGALSLAGFAAYGLVTVTMWGLVRMGRLDTQTYLAPLIFSNTGNLGLPLALFAFGDVGLGYAVVVFAVSAMIQFTFGIWLVSGGGSLLKMIQEPLVPATVLGAVFLVMDWQTPRFLTNALDLIAQMAIPIMLITLGVAVARLSIGAFGKPLVLAALKVVISAGCATAAGLWFGLEPVAFGVLVLQVATPVAVTSYMLAEKYGADAEAVAGLVVISTLMSVLTLPVILALVL
ncbi:MAG: AEC family transporter [Pseudomonadota bacterium]